MSDFSFEEATGTPAGKAPADGGFTFEEAGGKTEPRSEASIRLGGVAAGGKAVARTAADFGDMMLSIPGMVMGTAADAASRVQSIFEGNDPKTAGRISKEVREGVTSTFSPPVFRGLLEKAIQAASPDDEEASPTSLAHGMETISKGIEKGGKWVEKRTNGVISAETFDSLVNEGMALGGLKGMAVGTGGVGKALAERVKGEKPKAPEATYNPPEAAIDPVSRAKQDIERTTGIAEQEERASYRKQRMKEAASAFKDDAKFTAYAREHAAAEAEAFAASLPKIDPSFLPKEEPPVMYHGGASFEGDFNTPAFFTLDRKAAESYRSFKQGDKGQVTEARVDIKNPAREQDIFDAAKKVGVEAEDDAWKHISPMYKDGRHTKVVDELKARGFDGAIVPDVSFEGRGDVEIESHVAFSPEQIKRVPKEIDELSSERPLNKEAGGATLDTMKGIAALSVGLVAGQALDKDNPIEGAMLGAMGAVGLISGVVPKAFRSLRDLAKADERVRINNLTNAHEYQIAAAARDVWQVQQRIIELVPKQADRETIHRAIDAGRTGELKGKQAEAARIAQEFYEKIGAAAQDANVLKETRDDYTTHLWKLADKQKLNDLLSKKAGTPFSPSSRFAQGRLHVTLEEGKAAGLRPLTEDIAEVIGLYGNSLSRSIANRKLLDSLKVAKGPEGRLVLPGKMAPASFVQIDTPSMGGWKVHPDIAPSLKFVMEAKDPGAIVNGLLALNTALKRNVVSFSLFHAKALFDAALGALNNPGTAAKVVAQAIAPKVFGKNRYLKQIRDGGAGDLVDHALKSGLKFSYERGTPAVEDVGGGFYEGMKSLQAAMDKTIPYSGKATVGAYTRVNHAFDNFMWGRLHSAMKLETFAAKVEALIENSAKASKPLTKEAAGEIAARYTNDVFGGLNWRRMAEGAKTKWGRDLPLAMLSPKGRMGLQLLMFAPDWTLSTSRAFVKAFGKGSGVKGIFSATAEADLYRQQLLRSAFYYVAIGDAVNYANSGHHLWDNKDPFRVDLGDGRTMQLSKHFTEPFEWLQKPRQTAINKMGQLPKEGIEQLMQVERLQATGKMQPMQNPTRHALGNVVPFAVQPAVQGEPNAGQRAVASTLGTPIYGHTPEERRQIRFQQAQARYKKHMADLEKMSEGKK